MNTEGAFGYGSLRGMTVAVDRALDRSLKSLQVSTQLPPRRQRRKSMGVCDCDFDILTCKGGCECGTDLARTSACPPTDSARACGFTKMICDDRSSEVLGRTSERRRTTVQRAGNLRLSFSVHRERDAVGNSSRNDHLCRLRTFACCPTVGNSVIAHRPIQFAISANGSTSA